MTDEQNVKEYSWYKDRKMVAVVFLALASLMQIIAFLSVPGLTTIHKYTVGMMMGWYHPLFYGFIIFQSILIIFNIKDKTPIWLKLNTHSYIFVSISIIFIIDSTGYFQSKGKWAEIGLVAWHAIANWWDSFRESGDAWVPSATNGGVIGAFMYSLFAMATSGIGALVFSVVLLVTSVSLILSGSLIGLYRNAHKKRKSDVKKVDRKIEKSVAFSNIDTDPESKKPLVDDSEADAFPFEDPFGDD